VEAHLGSDLIQGPGQEVGGAHPSLEGSERVFDGHERGVLKITPIGKSTLPGPLARSECRS
jgi:hypothetical protein